MTSVSRVASDTGRPVLRVGALFAGYGGLDLAVVEVFTRLGFDVQIVWYAEIEPGACRILEHRFPGVPNLGDVAAVDWETVPAVDVITGGSPCQDLSHAGRRMGMTDGTRSNLWVQMREAIAVLRPWRVIWENVRGAYSAAADSSGTHTTHRRRGAGGADRGVVYEGGLLAHTDGRPTLRALGRVLGDLADLGFDAQWSGVRASDVGGCHQRFRVFVDAECVDAAPVVEHPLTGDPRHVPQRKSSVHDVSVGTQDLLSTPRAHDGHASMTSPCARQRAKDGNGSLAETLGSVLFPTPEAKLGSSGPDYARRDRPGTGGDSLHETVGRLLPTARATDGTKGGPNQRGSSGDPMLPSVAANLPTPTSRDHKGHNQRRDDSCLTGALMPTPSVAASEGGQTSRSGARADELLLGGIAQAHADGALLPTPNDFHMGNTETPAGWLERRADVEERTGTRHGPALPVVAASVADGTPLVQDGHGPRLEDSTGGDRWGPYAVAVRRWEALTRPAPEPTEPSPKTGNPRLSPRFVEWMMGLPDGWVTDVPGLTRNQQLRVLGNGVVPQQAAYALWSMLTGRT